MVGRFMKKIICLFITFFIGTLFVQADTTMDYHLQIKKDKIYEQIVFKINNYTPINNGEDTDAVLINQDIYSDKYKKTKYKKTVKKNGNDYVVTLTQNYNEYQFKNSYILKLCFDDFKISYSDTYYSLDINSKNYCNYADVMNIKVSSSYLFSNANGNRINDNSYTWTINDKADIEFRLNKGPSTMVPNPNEENNIKNPSLSKEDSSIMNYIVFIGLGLLVVGISIFFFYKYKKHDQINNSI